MSIFKEKKILLLCDFSVNLLDYEKHNLTNEFVDSLSSNMFLCYILLPSRITNNYKTVIDGIFSTQVSTEVIAGNLTATIFDYLPQYLIFFKDTMNTMKDTLF